ncbi:ribosomal protein L1p/L10e family-domain-containing protein [Hygrophoropsis aurantiaca]|uniref:Ribosomal protein L1p/L10e family-domain-containing protein n=1 Tax=Hygrophoropsis aurantiaca TaxID=72124 RepID=A0ACB8ALR5_9AGAM|nr:ribosomal protein L1p/L10e family-domain-containing protein [Hygrophoropsis aurantiaca]
MAKTELIDSHVSVKQCKLAVESLHAYASKKEKEKEDNELLPGNEQHIWLQIAVKKMHTESKIKPHKIPLKYPLVDPRTSSICLITKDPQREYKDLLEQHKIKFISRVVGVTKLKGKFKPFEARRMLLKENGMFLADERVIPLLPGLLGTKWFEAKKQPIPVCLTRKDLKGELERAIESTYLHQNKGTCTSVKVGVLSQTPTQIVENIKTALPAVVKNIQGEWDNIQSFQIKTSSSMSLPIWSCELGGEEGGRWDGLVATKGETLGIGDDEEVADDDKPDSTPKKTSEKAKTKGTKRLLDEATEKPKKKAKASEQSVSTVISSNASSPSILDTSSEKIGKKKKSSSNTAPPTSSAVDSPSTTSKKPTTDKKKTKDSAIVPSSIKEPLPSTEVVETTTKRSKKAKLSKDILAGTAAPASSDVAVTSAAPPSASEDLAPVKKKKGKKAENANAVDADLAMAVEPSKASELVSSSTSQVDENVAETAMKKKPRHRKRVAEAEMSSDTPASNALPTASNVSITPKELKQKRSAEGGEKKKAKVVKGQSGKSAKDSVLGKKRGQA